MKILIIEDEQNNADRLVRLVKDIRPDAEIVSVMASNAEVEDFFKQAENAPDVILSDIRLGDGLSFVGLKSAPQSAPVIFTTAYDQYALQAFKYNGLDYLLKPVDAEELRRALDKVVVERTTTTEDIRELLASAGTIRYRERFLIAFRDTFHMVPVSEMSHVGISDGSGKTVSPLPRQDARPPQRLSRHRGHCEPREGVGSKALAGLLRVKSLELRV